MAFLHVAVDLPALPFWVGSRATPVSVGIGVRRLPSLSTGRRGSWWQWLSGVAGLGGDVAASSDVSLPFALEGKVRESCLLYCGAYWFCLIHYNMEQEELR